MVLRLARCYVPTQALAEDVVQEAWHGALRGLDGFEGRSRLCTWVLRIVANIAKSWAEREQRVTPFSSAAFGEGPTVGPERFNSSGERNAGAWRTLPPSWPALPEGEVLSAEALGVEHHALGRPPGRPAGCHSPERSRRVRGGRGLRSARVDRGQSAGPPPPRPRLRSGCGPRPISANARGVLQRRASCDISPETPSCSPFLPGAGRTRD